MPQELTIQDLERLVDKFKIERYTYLALIAICAIIIIFVAIFSFLKGNWETGLSLMAPGGIIFFCQSKVFKLWDDIIKAFFNINNRTNGNN